MDVTTAIKERACVRNFTDQAPSKEQIFKILEAGRLAPSWVNVQPWHFIVIQNKEVIKLLGELSYGQPHVTNANTIIACCGTLDSWDAENYRKIIESRPNIPKEKVEFLVNTPAFSPELLGEDAKLYRTLEEVTYAIAYMTLEIENQGLAGCIIGGMGNPYTRSNMDIYEEVCKKLQLPKDMIIAAMLVLGYSHENKPEKTRKPLSEITSYNTFGNSY